MRPQDIQSEDTHYLCFCDSPLRVFGKDTILFPIEGTDILQVAELHGVYAYKPCVAKKHVSGIGSNILREGPITYIGFPLMRSDLMWLLRLMESNASNHEFPQWYQSLNWRKVPTKTSVTNAIKRMDAMCSDMAVLLRTGTLKALPVGVAIEPTSLEPVPITVIHGPTKLED